MTHLVQVIYITILTTIASLQYRPSELIEPVSPQAAQLGINFFPIFFHYTQLELHLLEGPY